ncbi:MAG: flavin reductase family protein [Methanocellales archaeon]|nr:flavin reductase family protein [Methanocellales archaeon]
MKLKRTDYYKLLVRPVVVVSTISEKGISNAAPFSFSSPLSFKPPLYGFSCSPEHHTWRNIKENEEFVVNIIGKDLGPLMHVLEENFSYEVNEIEKAGLNEERSKKIKPPRIREAMAWLECKLESFGEIGDHIWIVGRVLEAEVKDKFWSEVIDVETASPLCHISGEFFATEMKMKRYERALR